MKKEDLEKLKCEIDRQREELENNELLFSCYEKKLFILNYFDKDALLNVLVGYNRINANKGCIINLISGLKNNVHMVIDCDAFKYNGVNPEFPKDVFNSKTQYVFKNNEEGYAIFFKDLLSDKGKILEVLHLEATLENKEIEQIKKLKI